MINQYQWEIKIYPGNSGDWSASIIKSMSYQIDNRHCEKIDADRLICFTRKK